jgi:hypothetical protein
MLSMQDLSVGPFLTRCACYGDENERSAAYPCIPKFHIKFLDDGRRGDKRVETAGRRQWGAEENTT